MNLTPKIDDISNSATEICFKSTYTLVRLGMQHGQVIAELKDHTLPQAFLYISTRM